LRGQNFFFLDGRSFRDSRENKKGGHLGMAQRSWLHKSLQKTTGLNWLIMGDQFFGGYHSFESFEGLHPIQFNAFKNELKKLNKRYVFLSGDRHLVEAMKISKEEVGRTSMEYTISGMHTKTYKGALKRDPNPRRIGGFDGQENYGIFTTREFDNDQTSITLKAYSISGEKLSHEYVSK
jgi:phosphodiesterase/alkaline phosphatase D-like protein